jgi:hypothetical protein
MAAGREVTPADVRATARLKAYWATGAGREKWIHSPHPWTTLRDLLLKYVSKRVADGLASNIFHMATGIWPGERKGSDPLGPG